MMNFNPTATVDGNGIEFPPILAEISMNGLQNSHVEILIFKVYLVLVHISLLYNRSFLVVPEKNVMNFSNCFTCEIENINKLAFLDLILSNSRD